MSEKKELAVYTPKDLTATYNPLLNKKQYERMLKKTPAEHTYQRTGPNGKQLTYVKGSYMKKQLNFMFGWDWDFFILDKIIDKDAKQCIIHGRLVCRINDKEKTHTIIKEQMGRANIKYLSENVKDENGNIIYLAPDRPKRIKTDKMVDLGNDLKAAATDALKKCASELGVASDIYAPNEFKEIMVVDAVEVLGPDDLIDLPRLENLEHLLATAPIDEILKQTIESEKIGMLVEDYEDALLRIHNARMDPLAAGNNASQKDIKKKLDQHVP